MMISQRCRLVAVWAGVAIGVAALFFFGGCQPLPPRAQPFEGPRVDEWGKPVPIPAYTNEPWRAKTNAVPLPAGV